ncbi:MAG: DUF3857 domain-containing protein [Erythrobacter sp.]
MRNIRMAALATAAMGLAVQATSLRAGETIVYDAVPAWVDEAEIDASDRASNSPLVLIDQQARIEDGQLWVYRDTAVSLDSPQALTQLGTLSASWLPDKGDLIVHSVELIRDGEVRDLLDGGAEFEVLRREQGLESRLLNGALTATMTVPGAQIGDVVRFAISTTTRDQAMGDNVQWQSPLFAKPFPLEEGRLIVSWPEDIPVTRVHIGNAPISDPVVEDGFKVWSVQLPIDEQDEMPSDAPLRFRMGDVLQVSTYSDWAAVSRNMAQHYDPAGTIAPGGDLAEKVADIAAATVDPLERAARALRIVQDDVSYLMNGLNGGNYLPQSPEETWENRFGDCKAKSLLLLAMLRELEVTSEVVLVTTQGGDALPLLAPMPGNFNHMIVRAEIDGTNYWLDGTGGGTRINTIDEVPRFYHALPLRAEGAGLMPLDVRPQATPDRTVRLTLDHSAGLQLPALLGIELEYRGMMGAQWREVAELADEDARESAIEENLQSVTGGNVVLVDHAVEYDEDTGIAVLSARGVRMSDWDREGIEFTLDPPAQAAKDVGFNADRARAAWRDIPLLLNGPIYFTSETEIKLPHSGPSFAVRGSDTLKEQIGGVELGSSAAMEGPTFTLKQSMRSVLEELPAEDIPQAKRALVRFDRSLPVLQATGETRELWNYFGDDRALLEPLEAVYTQAIEEADPDYSNPYLNRARFRAGVYDHAGALDDIEDAHAIEASREIYMWRSKLRYSTGDIDGALEDLRRAEDLEPDGSTYAAQITMLAALGRSDEGIALAEDYAFMVDDTVDETELMASALGWSGAVEEGIDLLEGLAARRPGDGGLLNAICWEAGIWNRMDAERLETCVQAVEKSDYSAAALDSRALAHLRLGDFDAARRDIEAALLAEPGQVPSRLLRGIIRLKQDDAGGREEIELALAMQPELRAIYEAYGLTF